ncbi:anti-sigma factor [Pedobacter hartonius]|uniref:Anti-sigma-K factor rskA n=1 Tax=Pedobacter hartonius TaxID=425514 RepID=A0A1H3YYJ7_9SPHI|nr:anti-sigma factor [Pedobacter hartonius]SEA16208.1 Anti-sigma-K factor rskA [Pedobacter hartonius]
MEESKAYIETGILELYVLGQLNAQEQLEVEDMSVKYPEISKEINAIEIAMEKYAVSHSIKPTASLEKQIFDEIGATPAEQLPAATAGKIVPLHPDNSSSAIRTLRFALVACVALLLISVAALYSAHNKLNLANQQIASLSTDKEKFAATVSYIKDENKDLQEIAAISSDPTWIPVKLAGTKISPQANMMVYWHKKGQHVMVDNTKMALPENDASHQYQLWAMVDGKPVDLGVFDAQTQPKKLLLAMKEVGNAQAFAVTLEKRGGSVNPTMEKMVALGAVSI